MTKKIIAVFLFVIAICISFTSCDRTVDSTEIYSAENAGNDYHTSSSQTINVASSDYIQLSFDEKTYTVNVTDKANNYNWKSLPDKSNSSAYAFGVTLCTADGFYTLNTQDNSVAFSSASYEKTDNSIKVSYMLSDKKETATKSVDDMTSGDIFVFFSVTYTLDDQSLTAEINLAELECTKNAFVAKLSFLPCFGASYDDSIQDYILVPDGSGAVMHTGGSNTMTEAVSVAVYGNDPYYGASNNQASATVPVFGIKRNNNAFAAIITDGDALATINAAGKTESAPSQAYSLFTVTPAKTAENGKTYCGKTYNGSISVVYRFLADNRADYSGMAYAARDEFIKNGTLPYESYSQDDDSIPFCITVTGAQEGQTLTTIQQTIDIIDALKNKGIDNIQLNLKGFLSGGYTQKNLYNSGILRSAGGTKAYSQLYDYAARQNFTVYTDINIFSSAKKYISGGADDITSSAAFYSLANDLAYRNYSDSRLSTRIGNDVSAIGASKRKEELYAQTGSYNMYLTPVNTITNRLSAFLADDIADICSAFSVSDGGYILASTSDLDRQSAADIVSSGLKTLSTQGNLAVKGGNIYTLYGADFVSETEFDTFYTESESYEPVPFMQSIIHGSTLYGGKAIDAADPLYKYDMLQFIEYGAMPSFEWVYDSSSIFCYDGYLLSERITEISEYYKKADEALRDVSDCAIVSHRKITQNAEGRSISGVYCTTYSDGTRIYVNYTGSTVITPENIVVGAYDFIKVER